MSDHKNRGVLGLKRSPKSAESSRSCKPQTGAKTIAESKHGGEPKSLGAGSTKSGRRPKTVERSIGLENENKLFDCFFYNQ